MFVHLRVADILYIVMRGKIYINLDYNPNYA